jgi:hypothetical protein
MNDKMKLTAAGSLLLLASSQAHAHVADSGVGLLHLLSGEHLIMIVLAGALAVGITRLYRRPR